MDKITSLSRALGEALLAKGQKLSTAESCTGGWIAKSITDQPGSSAWFEYGFVSYSNEAKSQLLCVDPGIIVQHGAVSAAVVHAMAMGAMEKSQAHCSVAVSGVAGPEGGSDEKPVGTVWIAWGTRTSHGPDVDAERFLFDGDRASVRRQSVVAALEGLILRNA